MPKKALLDIVPSDPNKTFPEVTVLREKARRARRLASYLYNVEDRNALERTADDLERQADETEQRFADRTDPKPR